MDQRVKGSDYKFFLFSSLSRLSGICADTLPLQRWRHLLIFMVPIFKKYILYVDTQEMENQAQLRNDWCMLNFKSTLQICSFKHEDKSRGVGAA